MCSQVKKAMKGIPNNEENIGNTQRCHRHGEKSAVRVWIWRRKWEQERVWSAQESLNSFQTLSLKDHHWNSPFLA